MVSEAIGQILLGWPLADSREGWVFRNKMALALQLEVEIWKIVGKAL